MGKDESLCLRGNIQSQASIWTEPFQYHPVAVVDIWVLGSCPLRRGFSQEQQGQILRHFEWEHGKSTQEWYGSVAPESRGPRSCPLCQTESF